MGPPSASGPVSAATPLLFDYDDSARLHQLVSEDQLVVVDRLSEQRRALQSVAGGETLVHEPARWAVYPWRRTAVALLGPRGFRRLRLDRNRNKISPAEQTRYAGARIGVAGLSVGHVIAHTLALEGLGGELRLADFDQLELSNLNRVPASVIDLGLNKAVVTARRIAELDPYLPVTVFAQGVTADSITAFVEGLDVVIEECDSLDMKVQLRDVARAMHIPVVMETSDRGMLDVERFDTDPGRPLFHGLLGGLPAADLAGLSTTDKVPYVLSILEPQHLSARMAASMAEIDHTLSTWPQLGGDVVLGAATVAAAVRKLLDDDPMPSGRTRIDLDRLVEQLASPLPAAPIEPADEPPGDEAPRDPLEVVAHAASLAPSGGNMQPWTFEVTGDRFAIHLAPERSSLMDVQFRGSYVAIGAALYNARVAAAVCGLAGRHWIHPRPEGGEVAGLELTAGADPALAALYPAVLSRTVNRRVGPPTPIDDEVAVDLAAAAAAEGARLHLVIDTTARSAATDVLAESDRIRYLSPALHREMMGELRWPPNDPLDTGLDVRTLCLDRTDLAKLAVARRPDVMAQLADWDGGAALGDNTRKQLRGASGLAVLTIEAKQPGDYVRGGAALQRCWVVLEQHGLGAQPISPVFLYATTDADIAELVPTPYVTPLLGLQRRFRDIVGIEPSESLVIVLRLSHQPPPPIRSRRLPLAQVLHCHAG
jgi:nitroreductase